MLKLIKSRYYYFLLLAFMLVMAIMFCCLFSKSAGFIYLNGYHATWLDGFFVQFTFLGDGMVSVITVLALLLLKRRREALLLLVAFISSGLFSSLFKNLFSLPRPRLFFEHLNISYPCFIQGVTLANNSSFPSGHTTSAFAMATIFVLLSQRRSTAVVALVLASLVGYSRIYLGQHFLQDVVAGAFLGTFFALISYWVVLDGWTKFKPFKRRYRVNKEIVPQWN